MIEIHGHRGCRGLLPENTIPAFHKAIDLGCHYLELDVVITKDKQVLVSHEPWLNHEICLAPNGQKIDKATEKSYNLYEMTYAEIQQLDCGSIGHPRFAQQVPMRTYKPSLFEMITNMDAYTKRKGLLPIGYNVEVKRVPEDDGVFHPDGEEFSALVIDVFRKTGVMQRAMFQSFDIECMQIARRIAPELRLSFLVDNDLDLNTNLQNLGFVPPIYGPYFKQIDEQMMADAHAQNIKIIPWTVNETTDIMRLLNLGVAGLISDYPNRVVDVIMM